MLYETGLKIEYFVEEDQGMRDIFKDIVLDDHVSSGELFDAITHNRGLFDFRALDYWRKGTLHVIKVVNNNGATLNYAGYVLYSKQQPMIQIFTPYKKTITASKIHDLYSTGRIQIESQAVPVKHLDMGGIQGADCQLEVM